MELKDFKELLPEDFEIYKNYTQKFNNSESSIATMYMWQHYADVKYYAENNVLYSICQKNDGRFYSFMPYGNNRNSQEAVSALLNLFNDLNSKLTIKNCTNDFAQFILNNTDFKVNITPIRSSFDYVYKTEDLINLPGKKYHSKKNHINSFNKKYNYNYVKYNPSMKQLCIEFCKKTLGR